MLFNLKQKGMTRSHAITTKETKFKCQFTAVESQLRTSLLNMCEKYPLETG